jgi:hypothetical protein
MKTRRLTASSIYANEKQVPAIRLSGNWLVKNGFQTGRKFQVDEKPGSLKIHLILEEDERDVAVSGHEPSVKRKSFYK